MQWADIVEPFNAQFSPHRRERGALECRYYRFQLYPKVNEDGSFVFDDKGEIVMVNTKVRERRERERTGGKAWDRLNEYFKLVSRCPEKVVEYKWTEKEDKRKARQIRKCVKASFWFNDANLLLVADREKNGQQTQLPGALLRSRSSL